VRKVDNFSWVVSEILRIRSEAVENSGNSIISALYQSVAMSKLWC
jgi:hypothetical protein